MHEPSIALFSSVSFSSGDRRCRPRRPSNGLSECRRRFPRTLRCALESPRRLRDRRPRAADHQPEGGPHESLSRDDPPGHSARRAVTVADRPARACASVSNGQPLRATANRCRPEATPRPGPIARRGTSPHKRRATSPPSETLAEARRGLAGGGDRLSPATRAGPAARGLGRERPAAAYNARGVARPPPRGKPIA